MRIKKYSFTTEKLNRSLRLAVVADLHSRDPGQVIEAVRSIAPDAVCIAGDLTEALDGTTDGKNQRGFAALEALAAIAPTFYAPATMRSVLRISGCTKSRIQSRASSISPIRILPVSRQAVRIFSITATPSGRALP